MSTIIDTTNNSIVFQENDITCNFNIECIEKKYSDGIHFYYLNYDATKNVAHPLYQKSEEDFSDGEIIAKNPMTTGIKNILLGKEKPNFIDFNELVIDNCEIINKYENTILLEPLFSNDNTFCNVKTLVTEYKKDNLNFYKFSISIDKNNKANPYFYQNNNQENFNFFLNKNSITEGIIFLLFQTSIKLHSGNVDPNTYTNQIFQIIQILGDSNKSNFYKKLLEIVALLWD